MELLSSNIKRISGNGNLEKIPYISGNENPEKISYIFSKESFSYILGN